MLEVGVFHMICTLLRIIGKRFQDAGLQDPLMESGVVASGSVAAVLDGRHYNRAIRAHKWLYEAVLRIAWMHFQYEAISGNFGEEWQDGMKTLSEFSPDLFERADMLDNATMQPVLPEFKIYLDRLRSGSS